MNSEGKGSGAVQSCRARSRVRVNGAPAAGAKAQGLDFVSLGNAQFSPVEENDL